MSLLAEHLARDRDHAFLARSGGGLTVLVEAVRGAPAQPRTLDRLLHPTVCDVLQGEQRRSCLYGNTVLSTVRSTGKVSHERRTCKRRSCAACIPYLLWRDIRRTLAAWDGAPIFRRVFLSYEHWRNSADGKSLRSDYAGLLFQARTVDGSVTVLFPGVEGEGDTVESPGEEVFRAILSTEATGRRLTLPKAPVKPRDEEPDDIQDGAPDRVSFRIPYSVAVYEDVVPAELRYDLVNDLGRVDGYELAKELVTAALGRDDWQRDYEPSAHHFYRLVFSGLTPEDIDAVRLVIRPLHDLFLAEAAERREAKKRAAEYAGVETPW